MKFIHPPVDVYMELPASEVDMDVEIKYHPERYTTLYTAPTEVRRMPKAPLEELYNLKEDKSEEMNLIEEMPGEAAALKRELYDWFDEVEKERLS